MTCSICSDSKVPEMMSSGVACAHMRLPRTSTRTKRSRLAIRQSIIRFAQNCCPTQRKGECPRSGDCVVEINFLTACAGGGGPCLT